MTNYAERVLQFNQNHVIDGELIFTDQARTELTDLLSEAGFQKSGSCCKDPFIRGDHDKGEEVSYLMMAPKDDCECSQEQNEYFGVPCSIAMINLPSQNMEQEFGILSDSVHESQLDLYRLRCQSVNPRNYALGATAFTDVALMGLVSMAIGTSYLPVPPEWSPRTLALAGIAAGVATVGSLFGFYKRGRRLKEQQDLRMVEVEADL